MFLFKILKLVFSPCYPKKIDLNCFFKPLNRFAQGSFKMDLSEIQMDLSAIWMDLSEWKSIQQKV